MFDYLWIFVGAKDKILCSFYRYTAACSKLLVQYKVQYDILFWISRDVIEGALELNPYAKTQEEIKFLALIL